MTLEHPFSTTPTSRCILLAVDGSEHSMAAARLLSELPCATGCVIRVVAVMLPRQASTHALLEDALEQARYLLEQQGCVVITELLTGYPAEQIVQHADQVQPELIVLGARGLRADPGDPVGRCGPAGRRICPLARPCCPGTVHRSAAGCPAHRRFRPGAACPRVLRQLPISRQHPAAPCPRPAADANIGGDRPLLAA